MDKTLNYYINYSNETQHLFVKNGTNLSITKLKNNIHEIQIMIKNIQTVAKKLANVSNIANELILQRKRSLIKYDKIEYNSKYNNKENDHNDENKNIHDQKNEYEHKNEYENKNDGQNKSCEQNNNEKDKIDINIYPSNKDFTTLFNKYSNIKYNITDDKYNLQIPVKIIDHIDDIPINYIYYIKDIKQFGFNINGLTITGNIGSIDTNKNNLTICKYGIKCKNINNKKICNYYHNPNDILELYEKNIINNEIKELLLSKNIFNFTNGGWIYNGNILNNKNKNMRHIGGRQTIHYDLEVIKNNIELYQDEIEKRKSQSVHDILILAYLLNNQFMSDYVNW